jgi:hypothetical protein
MNWPEESSGPPPFAPPEARQNLFAARERERMRSACEHERMCSARASLGLGWSIRWFFVTRTLWFPVVLLVFLATSFLMDSFFWFLFFWFLFSVFDDRVF